MKAGDKKRRKTWKGRTVYWDTCVVLSWIKNEQRKPGHMEGVEEAVREIDKGEIGLNYVSTHAGRSMGHDAE